MYRESHKIENVQEFKIGVNAVIYKNKGSGRKNRSLFFHRNNIITSIAEGISGFQLDKNNIYYSNWNNESFKFNLESGNLFLLKYEQIAIYKLNDTVFFNKDNKYHLLLNDEYVISEIVLGYKNLLIGSKIFSTNSLNDNISAYDIDYDEKLDWEFSLSHYSTYKNQWQEEKKIEVSIFVGVWNKQLLVLLNNGMFIGIDVETGELLWKKSNVDDNDTTQKIDYAFGSPYSPFLNEEKSVIYILQGDTFIEFDLISNHAKYRWHSKDHRLENNLFIKQSRRKGNLIYFTAAIYPDLGIDKTIGIFDIDQNKVIWEYTIPFNDGGFIPNSKDNIQVNEKNLFVLDNKGDLHIFERKDQFV